MLKLHRKAGETIRIHGPSVIHVTKISKSRVQIGIVADGSVRVTRGEIATKELDSKAAIES